MLSALANRLPVSPLGEGSRKRVISLNQSAMMEDALDAHMRENRKTGLAHGTCSSGVKRLMLSLVAVLVVGACSNSPVHTNSSFPAKGLSTKVAAVGQDIRIVGSGFGNHPGEVLFTAVPGPHIAGRFSSWSDTTIQVEVPVSAVTGPVEVMSAASEPFYVGALVIEGSPNKVARLSYRLSGSSVAGQPIVVNLIADDSSGAGVPNVDISVTDGIGTISCTTNSAGSCSVSVTTYSGSTYVAISGTAWTLISIKPIQPATVRLSLRASVATLLVGEPATLIATVRNANGDIVPNVALRFGTRGSASVILSSSDAETNSSGEATITAMTSDNAASVDVEVGWSTALVTGLSPNHGPTQGNTLVTVSGSGFTASAKVYFGPQQASRTTFINSTTLTAVAPAGFGAVDIRVQVSGWTSDLTPADVYTYGT